MDEVGRGTSYEDGVSLAYAIMHYIDTHIQCRGIFATHFHEIAQEFDAQSTNIGCFNTRIHLNQVKEI